MKTNKELTELLHDSLDWARQRNYRGYSKFDALNSPLLYGVSRHSRFLRAAFVFGVSRFPVNIRPLLGVKKKQNPKGLALFARSWLTLADLTGNPDYQAEGLRLLDELLKVSQRDRFSGHCWGYEHPWQNIAFFIPPYEPNCVVTCEAFRSFLVAYQQTQNPQYRDILLSIADFLLNDLRLIPTKSGHRCCSYDLHSDWKVINVNALAASCLAKAYRLEPTEKYAEASKSMMAWVIAQQTPLHAWFYTDPPKASRITHDNYHTGFVLDAIQEFQSVFPTPQYDKAWSTGLAFYREKLFMPDYAPKWMFDKPFPHDIHGAAQGIITFSRAAQTETQHRETAQAILEWALANLFDRKQKRFYYQQGPHWTKRFTLMRWSQAWMCYAISEYLRLKKDGAA